MKERRKKGGQQSELCLFWGNSLVSRLSSIKILSGGSCLTGTVVSNCGGGHGVCVFAESVFIVRPKNRDDGKIVEIRVAGALRVLK